jgi:hypothetical protein
MKAYQRKVMTAINGSNENIARIAHGIIALAPAWRRRHCGVAAAGCQCNRQYAVSGGRASAAWPAGCGWRKQWLAADNQLSSCGIVQRRRLSAAKLASRLALWLAAASGIAESVMAGWPSRLAMACRRQSSGWRSSIIGSRRLPLQRGIFAARSGTAGVVLAFYLAGASALVSRLMAAKSGAHQHQLAAHIWRWRSPVWRISAA